ncbi:hypothetical protein PVAND_015195 [Polypedilum vanderplanki]|uniref:Lipocalin/cytosolic fatty-acid binding domain-containing protein n=1 Tax=Polypedilum vanderplanki TaxID=319348 RepID=A0A9J6BBK1_POLVA|nr:hypothetical protein PVAND_015195 [Polypedilum vanderplanki]
MEKFCNKQYKQISRDEFYDEYLKGLGYNYLIRKIATNLFITSKLSKINDEEFKIETSTLLSSQALTFKIGKEIENFTIEGRKVKSTFTIDDNKLIEKQIEGDKKVTIVRKFHDSELIIDLSVNGITTRLKNILIK